MVNHSGLAGHYGQMASAVRFLFALLSAQILCLLSRDEKEESYGWRGLICADSLVFFHSYSISRYISIPSHHSEAQKRMSKTNSINLIMISSSVLSIHLDQLGAKTTRTRNKTRTPHMLPLASHSCKFPFSYGC